MNVKVVAVLSVCLAAGAIARAQGALTDIRAVHSLTNEQASHRLAARFEATVTYYRDYDIDLFVQDGETALYVYAPAGLHLVLGDRVLIEGKAQDSFRPIVVADHVTLLHHGSVPKPIAVTAVELFSAQRDCQLATIRGTIRSAQMVWSAGKRNIYGQILIDGGYIDFAIASEDDSARARLLDAEVEMAGIVTSEFDQKMQQSGARLDVQSLSDIRILKPAEARPESLPVTPMEDVLSGYSIRDLSKRLQVKGTVTYYQAGRSAVLQSGTKSLWIVTQTDVPLRIGDIAYASGFPTVRNGYLSLDHSEIRDTHEWAPVTPAPVNWNEIGFGEHAFNLVSEDGVLVSEAREAAQDEYVLTSHGRIFSAIYRHPHGMSAAELPPMKQVRAGSLVRVNGISMFYSSDPFNGPVESDLLLRSFDDVMVIAPPSWFSKRNLEFIIAVLALTVLLISGWGWQLERRLRRHTSAAAARIGREAEVERQRALILEKINGTGPLAEILEMVARLASFRLDGAWCWCETSDGTRLGKWPPDEAGLVILRDELRAGGAGSGFIVIGLPEGSEPTVAEREVLAVSTALGSLAIETRRLYADLVHRTEYDMLTDAHNRFFLEKELELHIRLAQTSGDTFGLIYFDLDGFKQINDSFGHRMGDAYLQQFAQRIRGQLRPQDKLARVGGDEFAVLVPLVRGRGDLDEIVERLNASLEAPIVIENNEFRLSASFGVAMYPEDGTTRDALLDVADKAMYRAKGLGIRN